jgi:hypothetical protein
VERAAHAFRQLHERAPDFAFRFELFRMIDDYLAVLDRLGAELPEGYHDVVGEAGAVREALASNPLPLKPCHCDPLCENFLDTGERMWIVDWEYSGMNDPMWDLGDLSVEGGFDEAQDRRLLEAYFGGPASDFDRGRMVIYKAMCDLLWTLWGLIQHANKNPAEDFWAYALNRFDRCKRLMRATPFASHLEPCGRARRSWLFFEWRDLLAPSRRAVRRQIAELRAAGLPAPLIARSRRLPATGLGKIIDAKRREEVFCFLGAAHRAVRSGKAARPDGQCPDCRDLDARHRRNCAPPCRPSPCCSPSPDPWRPAQRPSKMSADAVGIHCRTSAPFAVCVLLTPRRQAGRRSTMQAPGSHSRRRGSAGPCPAAPAGSGPGPPSYSPPGDRRHGVDAPR